MTTMPIDPIEYFARNPLRESLLICFHADETREQVEIVYDYAAESVSRHFERLASGESAAPSQIRDFRRLVLTDVKSVTVVDSAHRAGDKGYWDSLNQEIARSPIVVQYESIKVLNGRYVLEVVISRGREYRIEFGSMLATRRLGTAIPTNRPDIWKYVDIETGKEFPFDRPFFGSAIPAG
jgi:hypothetical protein